MLEKMFEALNKADIDRNFIVFSQYHTRDVRFMFRHLTTLFLGEDKHAMKLSSDNWNFFNPLLNCYCNKCLIENSDAAPTFLAPTPLDCASSDSRWNFLPFLSLLFQNYRFRSAKPRSMSEEHSRGFEICAGINMEMVLKLSKSIMA